MIRRPPRSTRTDTLFPYTTRFRSAGQTDAAFTPGDLRRTVEARLAAVGIGQDVRARLQTHGLGGVQQRHYDRHDYLDEVRAALETLHSLLIAEPATITQIKGRRIS